MNRYRQWRGAAAAALLLAAAGVGAQEGREASPPVAAAGEARAETARLYVPPLRGAPERRVGGATRNVLVALPRTQGEGSLPRLGALAPDDGGQVGSASPVLYWFAAKGLSRTAPRFTLSQEGAARPVHESELPVPAQPGLQRLELGGLGLQLEAGQRYTWSISLAPPGGGDAPWVVGGALHYQPAEAPTGGSVDGLHQLAAAGRWYEAFAWAEDSLLGGSLSPVQRLQLLSERGQLLEEVGLGGLARQLPWRAPAKPSSGL